MKGSFSRGKTERLRRTIDFQRVFSQGECVRAGVFLCYILKRSLAVSSPLAGREVGAGNRIGFVVSKRVSKKAVTRNRVRRLLREVYRQNKGRLKEGQDLVVIAKAGAGDLSFLDVQETVLHLFRKAGAMKEEA